jgi:Tol biopolymer transport system component
MVETTGAMLRIRRPGLAVLPILGLIAALLVLARPAEAAFPGDNGKIAFQSKRTGTSEIFTMESDGTSPVQLTDINTKSSGAAWYPDGTGLAFENCCSKGTDQLEIFSMNANATGSTRLTNNSTRDALPVWSPDGTQIAFVSSRDGNKEIYVMDADGTGATNITNNASTDDAPAWSPDGKLIAFVSKRSGNSDIWVMSPTGTGVTRYTNDPATDTEPNWSPSGKLIAFETKRTGDREIYTMDSDGHNPVNISNRTSSDRRPAWSPNGKKIAFDSNRSGNLDIWVMDADGSNQKRYTNDPAKDQRPDWQPVTSPMFEGLDVSHWQGTIDFDAVAATGILFIFAKASEGSSYQDPNYTTNRANAQDAGLAFGPYHYARPDSSDGDAVEEADHFVDTADPASGDLLPVIDLEDAGGLSNTKLTDWLWDFLDEVLARTGVHALIYTSPNFWETHLGDTDEFAKGGYSLLWIAHWFAPTPTVPGNNWGGYGWTFWQNDDCFKVDGITGCVDHDYFNGINLDPALVP